MDINDNPPNFTQSGLYVFAVPTELEEGMVVGQVWVPKIEHRIHTNCELKSKLDRKNRLV